MHIQSITFTERYWGTKKARMKSLSEGNNILLRSVTQIVFTFTANLFLLHEEGAMPNVLHEK